MRFTALLSALLTLAGVADSQNCHRGRGHCPAPRAFTRAHGGATPYDAFYGIATHNSYWVGRGSERYASGTQERIIDQLVHEHVRALELDVHFNGKRPGVFSVYHTDNLRNSLCHTLEGCLEPLRVYHYAVPDHDVVNVVIELKELWGHVFDRQHTIAELDGILRRAFGDALYTPAEFASRCAPGETLRACARERGWPTVDELRGRVIVNVLGNFNYNANDWVAYATKDGGVLARAAFPMRSILDDAGGGCTGVIDVGVHDDFDPTELQAARDASIFWQVEQLDYAEVPRFLDEHGIVRGRSSATLSAQLDRLRRGFQLIQTDHPWHAVDFASIVGNDAPPPPPEFIRLRGPEDCDWVAAMQPSAAETTQWETLPSTTRPDTATRWSLDWAHARVAVEKLAPRARPRGVGCLRAADAGGDESFMLCRQTVDGEYTRISVRARHAPAAHDSDIDVADAGDLLKLRIDTRGGRSCVDAFVAGDLDGATPRWQPVAHDCFAGALVEQGVAGTRDVEFAGTRHDGLPVVAADLPLRVGKGSVY